MNFSGKIFHVLLLLFFCTLYAQKKQELKTVVWAKNTDNIEFLIKNKAIDFVQFGIMAKNHLAFSEKFGVGVRYENCVLSPTISKDARENNKALAYYLTQKYGDTWKKELGFTPYGL